MKEYIKFVLFVQFIMLMAFLTKGLLDGFTLELASKLPKVSFIALVASLVSLVSVPFSDWILK